MKPLNETAGANAARGNSAGLLLTLRILIASDVFTSAQRCCLPISFLFLATLQLKYQDGAHQQQRRGERWRRGGGGGGGGGPFLLLLFLFLVVVGAPAPARPGRDARSPRAERGHADRVGRDPRSAHQGAGCTARWRSRRAGCLDQHSPSAGGRRDVCPAPSARSPGGPIQRRGDNAHLRKHLQRPTADRRADDDD